MKYAISAIVCFLLSALLLVNYAKGSGIGDEINGESFRPQLKYKTVDSPYTGWNKANLIGMIALYGLGDLISTNIGLNSGLSEGNTFYGKSPSMAVLIPVKIVVIGAIWAGTEYLIAPEDRQSTRNYMFGSLAAGGLAVTTWNVVQILR